MRIKDKSGKEFILILENQTYWSWKKLRELVVYRMKFLIKYDLPVNSVMFLFQKNEKAVSYYQDNEVSFNFTLVKFWELEPKIYLKTNELELFPFIPLMKEGTKFVDEAERRIYSGDIEKDIKADLLTSLAIFTGMKDVNLAQILWKRRRDIMIESPVYDMIKNEGLEEGEQKKEIEVAKNMIKESLDIVLISRVTGLPIEKIKELKENKAL